MLQVFVHGPEGLAPAPDPLAALQDGAFVWADLFAAGEGEELSSAERTIEVALGVDVPTPQERRALEESARFSEDGEALLLTATLMGMRDEGAFVADGVSFILHRNRLVTVRAVRPRAFTIGEGRAAARIRDAVSGQEVFVALLSGVVERIADVLAEITTEATQFSRKVFVSEERCDLRGSLRALGRLGTLCAVAQDSLVSLQRLFLFVAEVCERHGLERARFDTLGRDVRELELQVGGLQAHIGFLQQSALGLVGAAQNDTLRAVALATIAFAPPTLVASIFGMNFEAMHWFRTGWGPWAAGALMLAAPLGLFGVARWRCWF